MLGRLKSAPNIFANGGTHDDLAVRHQYADNAGGRGAQVVHNVFGIDDQTETRIHEKHQTGFAANNRPKSAHPVFMVGIAAGQLT
jgi:hypothetical protein